MIELLVASDTHGAEGALQELLSRCRSADAFLFLGDGLREVEAVFSGGALMPLYAVRGNCDSAFSPFGSARQEELVLALGDHRLLLLHGHAASVKLSLDGLLTLAVERAADIVLFGHTHVPYEGIHNVGGKPIHLFNPGSLGRPLGGAPSFGRLALDERGGVLFSHGNLGGMT